MLVIARRSIIDIPTVLIEVTTVALLWKFKKLHEPVVVATAAGKGLLPVSGRKMRLSLRALFFLHTMAWSNHRDIMKVPQVSRVIAAIITIFSLLFTQFALASYACPELNLTKPVAMAMDAAQMPGCANMDMKMDQPGLCHSHCEAGNQSANTPQAPLVQPFVAAQLSVVLSVLESAAPCHALHPEGVLLKRSTAPPLAIRNCCFRI